MTLSINYSDNNIESFYLSGIECKEFLKALADLYDFANTDMPTIFLAVHNNSLLRLVDSKD
jgi:hypothetical protein